MRPTTHRLAGLLLVGLGLPPGALAAAPAGAAPAAAGAQPVERGAVVSVDLSRLPTRVERRGTALCVGARMTLVGVPEEVRCQRPFTYDAPVEGDPLVLVFQPSGGGRPTRVEIPYQREPRPRTFTAPSAGTVTTERPAAARPPAPAAKGEEPPRLPQVQAERARAAATAACGDCRGAPSFALKDYTIEAVPPSSQEVVIDIRQPAP
jgi:hypothetical protein